MRRSIVILVQVLAAAVWPAAPDAANGSTTTQPAPPTSQQADFNNDGADDLAVGVPGQHVGAPPFNSGAVNVLYGSATGLTAAGSQLFTQNTPGVPGTATKRKSSSAPPSPPATRVPHRRQPPAKPNPDERQPPAA